LAFCLLNFRTFGLPDGADKKILYLISHISYLNYIFGAHIKVNGFKKL